MKLLEGIGILAVIGAILYRGASKFAGKLEYGFKKLALSDFDLLGGKIRMTFFLKNKNNFEFTVEKLEGHIEYGTIRVPIVLREPFTAPPNTEVDVKIGMPVTNLELLGQIIDLIRTGDIPYMYLRGNMAVAFGGKSITVPVDTIIQLL